MVWKEKSKPNNIFEDAVDPGRQKQYRLPKGYIPPASFQNHGMTCTVYWIFSTFPFLCCLVASSGSYLSTPNTPMQIPWFLGLALCMLWPVQLHRTPPLFKYPSVALLKLLSFWTGEPTFSYCSGAQSCVTVLDSSFASIVWPDSLATMISSSLGAKLKLGQL